MTLNRKTLLILVLTLLITIGCASIPNKSKLLLTPGKSKTQVDSDFAEQNNNTGHWASRLVKAESKNGAIETVYIYRWEKKPGLSITTLIHVYQITFLDEKIVSSSIIGAERTDAERPPSPSFIEPSHHRKYKFGICGPVRC